jgi:hypothetical protein
MRARKANYIAYSASLAIIIIYLSQMHNYTISYTNNNSIPMTSFVKAGVWLHDNLNSQKMALVPEPTVFYVLEPQIKNRLIDYKSIWDVAGVQLRANTTDSEVLKVKQKLIDFMVRNKQIEYLVLDWFYPYSHKIFKTSSCSDIGNNILRQVSSFNFTLPESRWHNKVVICQTTKS